MMASRLSAGALVLDAELELPTTADTEALGEQLAPELRAGDLLVVSGPLGAGKTALVRGLARGLGVAGPVTSPTFVIAREHRPLPGGAGVPLVHVDAYRLGSAAELDDLDLDTDLADAVVAVEWGEGVAERLAARHLLVRLERRLDEVRVAHVRWLGEPAPPEAARAEAVQADAVQADPDQADAVQADAARAKTARAGAVAVEAARVEVAE
jgi:tRNA threonylcarbamoyladenosine biosynthesis protein TsaE